MGQAKRRKAEIERLKTATPEKPEKIVVADYHFLAMHEGAHVLANHHYGIPIGERGVSLECDAFGTPCAGFTDSKASRLRGTMPDEELLFNNRVVALAGPLAELGFFQEENLTDGIIKRWCAACKGDFDGLNITAQQGLMLWFDFDTVKFDDEESRAYARRLFDTTEEILNRYRSEIVRLADALLDAPEFHLSGEQIAALLDERLLETKETQNT
jgi:hypothetical protein